MVAKVKIYKPTKNAMQSGKAKTKLWVLEFLPEQTRYIENVMGWSGNTDTKPQIKLTFSTLAEAEAYAKAKGFECHIIQPHLTTLRKQAYADNFTG